MEKKIIVWEPWFFMVFGLFHLHRIWGLTDRNSYAEFWIGVLENKDLCYVYFDVNSIYWNAVWSFFILLGGFAFVLGIKLQRDKLK